MDAFTLQILAKLIGFGIATHKGIETEGITSDDVSPLKALLGAGATLLGRKHQDDLPARSIQLGLVTRSFGIAIARHWAFNEDMVPTPSRLPRWARKIWESGKAKRYEEIETRVRHADLEALMPGDKATPLDELAVLQQLTAEPMNSPYYRALWDAFSDPALDEENEVPPICLDMDGAAREFERYFREAFREALTTDQGKRVQRWRRGLLSETTAALRWGLMENMAGWGRRHVIGNATESGKHDVLPFMPLDDIYVEPQGKLVGSDESPQPIKTLIAYLLKKHQIVVVKADFGHGKSLTARSLAKELAQQWLSNNRETGSQLPMPVFIKCARDIKSASYEHAEVVRTALWEQARNDLKLAQPRSAKQFQPLEPGQRTLFILDGLDEVSLEPNQLRGLFDRLDEEVIGEHRAVVFSRPGALGERQCVPKGTPVVDLFAFDPTQIDTWVSKWNALPGHEQPIPDGFVKSAGVHAIVKVPILLLMVAMTSHTLSSNPGQGVKQTELYRLFLEQVARGKLRQDPEDHDPIKKASEELLSCLSSPTLGILDVGAPKTDSESEDHRIEAMLWLMSRVAWEAHERAYRSTPEPLQADDVRVHILKEELGLTVRDVQRTIELGLVLAMQIDPAQGANEILFGHQSFREFLVARYWRHELQRLVRMHPRDRGNVEGRLMKARLLQPGDAAFSMLQEMLVELDPELRDAIRRWGQDKANDESLSSLRLREDRSSILRESAIGIGSCIGGIELADRETLRSLLAWFYLRTITISLYAPNLASPRASLEGANLEGANLEGANLEGANLERANLEGADLEGANLRGANLRGAFLESAYLEKADLQGSNLARVDLEGVISGNANFARSNLFRAYLVGGMLINADFSHAKLVGTNLQDADLQDADLRSADLRNADLQEADLQNADLRSADLRGADLRNTDLQGARYNQETQWPPNFDPQSRNACLSEL